MKFTVFYIDDKTHSVTFDANTALMAAWRFVATHPRTDTSQITVESHPSTRRLSPEITHYRACDIINTSAPPDEAEPELAIHLGNGRELAYVVSGNIESLQALGTSLLRNLAEFPDRPNPLGIKQVYRVPVVPGDGSRRECSLSFAADPDVEQYWARRSSIKGLWTEYGRCLCLLVLFTFAAIGIWTVAAWIL